MAQTLEEILHETRVPHGSYTHTSMVEPRGKFYMTTGYLEKFYELYEKAIQDGNKVCITEAPRIIGPILIDCDFRMIYRDEDSVPQKSYSYEQIDTFVDAIRQTLDSLIDYSFGHVYILEKDDAPKKNNKGQYKDGIHIMIPDVVVDPVIQYILRDNMLQKTKEIFHQTVNTAEEIYDHKVIYENPWIMYGGIKEGDTSPYKLTRIVKIHYGDETQESVDTQEYTIGDIIRTLSLQNKTHKTVTEKIDVSSDSNNDTSQYDIDISNIKNHIDHKRNKESTHNTISVRATNTRGRATESRTQEENKHLAHQLIGILDPKRADEYDSWIRVGWALHNISDDLLESWITFSQQSDKFTDETECKRLWYSMRDQGLSIASLRHWAKQDAPEEYKEIVRDSARNEIDRSLSDTSEYQIAKVIVQMYKDRYVCVNIKSNIWYYFNGYRWVREYGSGLNFMVSEDIYSMYMKKASDLSLYISQNPDCENEQKIQEQIKTARSIAVKLRSTSFKDKIFKELRLQMFNEKFIDRLDENRHLLAFEDCVVDLDTFEIREPRPEDMISMSTGYNFEYMAKDNVKRNEVQEFLNSIYIDEDIRHYALKVYAAMLHGEVQEQYFHINTGAGSNGKSKLFELMANTLGDYYHQIGVQYLTQSRSGANQAESDIAQAKGKRCIATEEPESGGRVALNTSVIKQIAEGSRVRARELFQQSSSVMFQGSLFMACNNMPEVNTQDYGTWRRMKVIPHKTWFVHDPNPNQLYQRAVDRDLGWKIQTQDWKCSFMSILLDMYAIYKKERLYPIPDEVDAATKEYRRKNDITCQFVDEYLVEDADSYQGSKKIAEEYTNFCKKNGKPRPKRTSDIGTELTRVVSGVVFRNQYRWYLQGYRLATDDDEE